MPIKDAKPRQAARDRQKAKDRRSSMVKIVMTGDKNRLSDYIQMSFADMHPEIECWKSFKS